MTHPKITKAFPEELPLDDSALRRVDDDPNLLKICSEVMRPGAWVMARGIELTHYTPYLPVNDDYQLYRIGFDGIPYIVVAVPMKDRPKIEAFLKGHGLRLQDGVPHSISVNGVRQFPFRSNSTFTLGGSFNNIMYEGTAALEQAKIIERQVVEGFDRAYNALYAQQPKMWWMGEWWHDVTRRDAKDFFDKGLTLYQSMDGRYWLQDSVKTRLGL
jgi:hypothetical protein